MRARITSRTASAWVKSRRPERKARRVNSPGWARRAPCSRTRARIRRQHPVAGVAVDLHHVFPGIGVGGLHPGEEHFVDDLPLGVDDVPQIEPVGAPGLAGSVGAEDAPGDGGRLRAAETDDADARLARGGGNGGNGIGRVRPGHAGPAASSWPSFFLTGEMITFL